MARGTQLRELVNMLRAEGGQSLQRSTGINSVEASKYALRNTYAWLYSDFDWPFLKIERDVPLQAGERFYAFPADMTFENVEAVWTEYGSEWRRVPMGIDSGLYTEVATADWRAPVARWDARENDQFEVWPTPPEDAKLRLSGTQKFVPLLNENDICLLDDLMVVWWTVARASPTAKSGAGPLFLELAKTRLRKMRAKSRGTKSSPFVMGGGETAPVRRPEYDCYMPERH